MRQLSTTAVTLAAGLALGLAGCTSGNNGNSAPRLTDIPTQTVAGGAFTLDLSAYVTDREGGTLTYEVVSGGGAFAGSVYSNTFDTMGSYTVVFRVTDPAGKLALGTFTVTDTAAEFVVVRQDNSGLLLLDAATGALVTVAANSQPPSLATGLGDGRLVYQLAVGTGLQLYVFDPMQRLNTRVGSEASGDVTYRATVGNGSLVFTTGTVGDTDLQLFDTATGLTREISAQPGELDENPMVNSADLVFYERGSLGQADIYYYDPTTDTSTSVSTAATDEHLLAVLADGGVVFSRVGGSGETDLFYFKRGTGLVEIGGAVTAIVDLDKGYDGCSSDSKVVFTVADGSDRDLYVWNPADGQTTPIATGAVYGFEAIAAGNELVYRDQVSGSERDLYFYDLDDATAAVVRDAGDESELLAVTGDGSVAWAIVRRGGTPTTVDAVSLVAAPATVTLAGGASKEFQKVLGNGDVVVRSADGTGIDVFDVAGASWTSFAGTGLAYAGPGVDAGDFVYSATAAAQTDLYLWDASAATAVPISTVSGNDVFQCTAGGRVLFSNDDATFANLFAWNPTDLETVQLTDEDSAGLSHDYSVLGSYSGSR